MPRPAHVLPDDVVNRLKRATEEHARAVAKADAKYRAEVVAALAHGSVRQVAEATGLSPTTVQRWAREARS